MKQSSSLAAFELKRFISKSLRPGTRQNAIAVAGRAFAVENLERRLMLFGNDAVILSVLQASDGATAYAPGSQLTLTGGVFASGYTTAGNSNVGGSPTPTGTVAVLGGQPGEYTVHIDGVDSSTFAPSTLVDGISSHPFKVFPAHLVFTTQPEDEPAINGLPEITVEIQGADGATLNSQGDFVQISYVPIGSPASSAVVLATQQVTNSTSVSFDLVYVHAIGAFQLIATLLSSPTDQVTTTQETVTPATSHTFTIQH